MLGDRALREVTTVCAAFDVDGLRADLVTAKAAVALAAWAGRDEVTTDDVRTAARLALPHRRRRTPFEAPGLDEQQLDDALDAVPPDAARGRPGRRPRRRRRRRAAAADDGPPSGGAAEPQAPRRRASAGRRRGREPRAAAARRAGGAPASAARRRRPSRSRPVALRVPGVNRRGGAAGRRSRTARAAAAG